MHVGLGFWAFCALVGGSSLPQEHSLLPRIQVGERYVYDMRSVTKVGANEITFQSKFETLIDAIAKGTTIAFKTVGKGGKMTTNGVEAPVPESTTIARTRLTGELVGVEPVPTSILQARSGRLMRFQVPEERVKVGSKWSWKDPASDLNGKIAGEGTGECLAFEKRGETQCAKLRFKVKETGEGAQASSAMDVWLSLEDGMWIELAIKIESLPFGTGLVGTSDVSIRRIEKIAKSAG